MTLQDYFFTHGKMFNQDSMVPISMAKPLDSHWGDLLSSTERLKLVFIESSGGFITSQGKDFPLEAPVLLFIPREQEFQLSLSGSKPAAQLIAFHPHYFHADLDWNLALTVGDVTTYHPDSYLMTPFAPGKHYAQRVLSLDPVNSRLVGNFFTKMQDQLTAQPDGYWTCRGRSYLLQLLILATQLFESGFGCQPQLPSDKIKAEAVKSFLQENISRKIRIDQIAAHFGSNRTGIQELFRNETGTTIMQYLISLRIQSTEILLRNTGLTLDEIACRTGLVDASTLTRTFKKQNRMSPGEYRKSFVSPHYL